MEYNVKELNKNERISGDESSNIILYSDDYDGLDNSDFNTKVCMLTFWQGYLYFPGGLIDNKKMSFEDNIIDYVKKLLDFDISHYKQDIKHISSYYISDDHTSHTYALKLEKMDMIKLQLKNISFDEKGEPDESSLILLDTCGISKFNISEQTLDLVMKNNFGPGVKESLTQFVDMYIKPKMKKQQEFISEIKNKMEMKIINQRLNENKDEIFNGLQITLKNKGIEYLLDENDPRYKEIVDENGNFKDGALDKIFNEIEDFPYAYEKKKVKISSNDFRQKNF